ncbi:MAG: MarC family protein [Opitutales bacterium]|nr:MarC family protein [Opitutales bacterium]
MTLLEFALLAPVSLFVVINPLSTVPAFLSMTSDDDTSEKIRMARFACFLAAGILILFALTGSFILGFMGISIPALQIAGGLVLVMIGLDMLRAPTIETRLSDTEQKLARKMEDVAVTPLAIPLLCGPGAISTVVILQTQSETLAHLGALLVSVPLVYAACFGILFSAAKGSTRLNPIVLRVLRRIMGLLFVCVAIQFGLNGIEGFTGNE